MGKRPKTQQLKIATWNVNSINARLPNLLRWLESESPDVLLLQELKCTEDKFPALEIQALGYNCAVAGQKTWNGVAILSRHPVKVTATQLQGDASDEQARYIEADVEGLRLASIYLPNGNPVDTEKFEYKLAWMKRLKKHVAKLMAEDRPLVLGGDYNIIPANDDCYDPKAWAGDALFRPESKSAFREIVYLGLTDAFRALHPALGEAYTFWDYQANAWPRNAGIRIDHFLLSAQAVDLMEDCAIDKAPRGWDKASDHTPVVLSLRHPAGKLRL